MPARDIFHHAVRLALQKDGWTITHDPLTIDLADGQLQVDLGAERLIAAQKNHQQIAVLDSAKFLRECPSDKGFSV